jgi:hypothetical protein
MAIYIMQEIELMGRGSSMHTGEVDVDAFVYQKLHDFLVPS